MKGGDELPFFLFNAANTIVAGLMLPVGSVDQTASLSPMAKPRNPRNNHTTTGDWRLATGD